MTSGAGDKRTQGSDGGGGHQGPTPYFPERHKPLGSLEKARVSGAVKVRVDSANSERDNISQSKIESWTQVSDFIQFSVC